MSKKSILQEFGANAESYAASKVHAKGASLSRLVKLVNPSPNWRMLDIATGAGHTALAFAPFVAEVLATDITPEMLEQTERLASASGYTNIRTETADAEDLPYPDNSFDLVTCRIAPHHFSDIALFLSESSRVLQPSGVLAIVDNIVPPGRTGDYVNAFEKLRDPSHGRCLTSHEWIDIAFEQGLQLLHEETLVKTMDFSFWAQRHDPIMQRYLLAMLFECSTAVANFFKLAATDEGVQFQLQEGLFIFTKAA